MAPDVTLEDSGELSVGSFYAGVPHPPGYPVWTLYSWLFTQLPISNIAFEWPCPRHLLELLPVPCSL